MPLPLGYRSWQALARILFGYCIEYLGKVWGTTAAINVIIGDGETFGAKVANALTSIPDLTRTYRQLRYVADHAPEINAALDYLREQVPTPEALQVAIDRTYATLHGLNTALARFAQVKDNVLGWSWQPTETYRLLQEGWAAVPDLDAFQVLAASSQHAAEALRRLRQIDINPLYQILMNAIDNFARDEIVATVVVATAALLISSAIGVAVGRFWARRGLPGILVRQVQRLGVRFFPGWYRRNLPRVLGPELYALAEQHFSEKAGKSR